MVLQAYNAATYKIEISLSAQWKRKKTKSFDINKKKTMIIIKAYLIM